MKLPKQAPPIRRPELIYPQKVINFQNAKDEQIEHLKFQLGAGANYNDPMRFSTPVDFCGCHLLFGTSRAMCEALCLR